MKDHSDSSPEPKPLAAEELQAQADAAGPEAQNNLGVLYASGDASGGTFQQDDQAAARCFRKAAEQGCALAQTNLARMCAAGQGQPKDEVEAGRWFRRAANQGDPGAQFHLGITMHRLSLNADTRAAHEAKVEGFMWLQLAAAQGFYLADVYCDRLNLKMTAEQITAAKERAASFVAKAE
jgi:TPR repeat protein